MIRVRITEAVLPVAGKNCGCIQLAIMLAWLMAWWAVPCRAQNPSTQTSAAQSPEAHNPATESTTGGSTVEQATQASGGPAAARNGLETAKTKGGWRYQVEPGDLLAITFPFTPEFDQEVPVQPDGYVTLRAIGEIPVAGETLPELRQQVRTVYAKTVSPQVITVQVKDFEKPYFVVGGEVGRPGKFDLRHATTVTEAVQIAGGFRDSAKHSQVLLFRRVSDDWMEAKKLDMKKMLNAGKLNEDLELQPGDLVYVPKNVISKIKPFIPVSSVGTTLSSGVY